jgi:hypothetical protein
MTDIHGRRHIAAQYTVGEIKALIGPLFGLDPAEPWGYVVMIETAGTDEDEGFVVTNHKDAERLSAHLQDVIDSAKMAYEEDE